MRTGDAENKYRITIPMHKLSPQKCHFCIILIILAFTNLLRGQQKFPGRPASAKKSANLELMDYRIVRFKLPQRNAQNQTVTELTPGFRFTFRYSSPNLLLKGVSHQLSGIDLYGSTQSTKEGLNLVKVNSESSFFISFHPQKDGDSYLIKMDVPTRNLAVFGNQFRVVGKIAFLTAKETAIETSRIIPLMIGENIKAGPFIFQIRELRKPDFGGDALEIVLVPDQFTADSKDNILHINFLDETGKTVRTKSKGNIKTINAQKYIYSLNINPKRVITEITYLKEKSYITVPFEVKTGFEIRTGSQIKK